MDNMLNEIATRINAKRDLADCLTNATHAALVADTILSIVEEIRDIAWSHGLDGNEFVRACGFDPELV